MVGDIIESFMKYLTGHNLIIALILTAFVYVAIFGLSFGMNMSRNGQMTHCPFMSETSSLCQMTIGDHVSAWQNILANLAEVVGLVWLGVILTFSVFRIVIDATGLAVRNRRRRFDFFDFKIFNFLHLVFADGILNSRIYA